MENIIKYIFLIFCTLSLIGCERDYEEHSVNTSFGEAAINHSQNRLNITEPDPSGQTQSDILSIGLEFAKDLAADNFVNLLQTYQYDDNMNKEMASDIAKKTVVLHNARYGKLQAIMEPYSISAEAYQYVMVPVVCSENSFNYQIVFDEKQRIIGFSYADYAEREQVEDKIMPAEIIEKEYTFKSGEYELSGTLTTPKDGSNFPVVILVQGNGALDRDESIYENKPFRDIAWEMGRQGIATFRYDKRNYTYKEELAGDTSFTVYEETIDDVVSAVNFIKGVDDIEVSNIFLLGHSLGGYVIPLIAKEIPDTAGYILLAAPAEPFPAYALEQYELLAEDDDKITASEKNSLNNISNLLKMLANTENIPENMLLFGAYKKYWSSLFSYDALKEADKIKKPVLVQHGERDYQIPVKEFTIWKEHFEDNKYWTFKSYNNLDHFMMPVKSTNLIEQYSIKTWVSDTVIGDIVQFIKENLA